MPIYEYRCDDCGAEFEKRVARAADSEGVRCPSCGENHLTPRLSTFSTVTGDSAPRCSSADYCPNRGTCGMG
jgi:putative FmdB family regulatory protein